MRTHRSYLWLATLVLSLWACRHAGEDDPSAVDPDTAVMVQVENHFRGDVIIYLVVGTQRVRLGTVTALGSQAFSFPWRRLQGSGVTRLLAHPLASRSFASDPLMVQPGQSITWTIESNLERSTLTVY